MIYFFYGDEEYNILTEIKKLKSELDKNFLEMSYKEYENPNFADLIAIISTQPMMFGKMLIVIDCIDYFKSKKEDGFDDKQIKQLEQSLNSINENLDIVFKAWADPESKKKINIDKRKKIFKILSKYNAKEFLQIPSYKTEELENWIKIQAKQHNLKISTEAISALLLQVGANLRMLDSELEKLKIYVKDSEVTRDMIREICVNNEDLFSFIDYLVSGDKLKALEEYQKLLVSSNILSVLAVLHSIIHNKIYIKANCKQYSSDEIARMINIHPYRVKLEVQKLKKVSLKNLIDLKKKLTEAEYKIKSGQSNLTPEREVEYAILR